MADPNVQSPLTLSPVHFMVSPVSAIYASTAGPPKKIWRGSLFQKAMFVQDVVMYPFLLDFVFHLWFCNLLSHPWDY